MKNAKVPIAKNYQDYFISALENTERAAGYIQAILEVEDPEPELLHAALQDIIDARVQSNNFSAEAKGHWEKLEKRLSESDGAEIYALVALLEAIGCKLDVTVK